MAKRKDIGAVNGQIAFLNEQGHIFEEFLAQFIAVEQAPALEFDDDWDAPVIKPKKNYKVYESQDHMLRMTWPEIGYVPVKIERKEDDEWIVVVDRTNEDN